jgi:hypothetical protein
MKPKIEEKTKLYYKKIFKGVFPPKRGKLLFNFFIIGKEYLTENRKKTLSFMSFLSYPIIVREGGTRET